jgi:hypothetical protein
MVLGMSYFFAAVASFIGVLKFYTFADSLMRSVRIPLARSFIRSSNYIPD